MLENFSNNIRSYLGINFNSISTNFEKTKQKILLFKPQFEVFNLKFDCFEFFLNKIVNNLDNLSVTINFI